jgi:hypothetical protein
MPVSKVTSIAAAEPSLAAWTASISNSVLSTELWVLA